MHVEITATARIAPCERALHLRAVYAASCPYVQRDRKLFRLGLVRAMNRRRRTPTSICLAISAYVLLIINVGNLYALHRGDNGIRWIAARSIT